MSDLQIKLKTLNACRSAIKWVEDKTLEQAWNVCPRADWMLWFAARLKIDHKLLVLTACACARTSLQYLPAGEDRPRIAIETTEKWARAEATLDEVCATHTAYATCAAAHAAAYATYAAHDTACAIYATNAVRAAADAARAASYAAAATVDASYADAADAAYTAAADAADAAYAEMANLLRTIIPVEMIVEAMRVS